MALPTSMRTGITLGCAQENMYTETFFIIYHVLGAILRRSGFKDCLTYSEHNSIFFNQEIFNSGILFNLFSEYGIGKLLEPLIKELFRDGGLDPEKHKNNIFFYEIVRLTPIVSNVIRSHDPEMEAIWLSNYAMSSPNLVDPLSIERDIRLHDILDSNHENNDSYDDFDNNEFDNNFDDNDNDNDSYGNDNNFDDNDNDSYDNDFDNNVVILHDFVQKTCECSFCKEFRKYYENYKGCNVTEIINNMLTDIAHNVNKNKLLE